MAFQYVDFPESFRKTLEDIFTDEFMKENSSFESFEAFQYSSAVFLNWKSDTLVYNEDVFDAFVRESTRFSGWDEMVRTAADLRFKTC